MSSENPLVSVIIPVYNGSKYLSEAIDSVANQTYTPLEIIMVDDGSTDDSVRIAESFHKIKIIKQKNQGNASARNEGIKKSQGKFISFLDADDYWTRDKIKTQIEFLLGNTEFDCVVGKFKNFFQPGEKIPQYINKMVFLNPKKGEMLCLGTLLAPITLFDRVGLFNRSLRIGVDLDWFFKAREIGIKIGKIPEILMFRRLHGSNISYRIIPSELIEIFRDSIKRKRG